MNTLQAGAGSLREGAERLRGGLSIDNEFGELGAVGFRFGPQGSLTQEREQEEQRGPLSGVRGAIDGAIDDAIQNTIGNAFNNIAAGGTRILFIVLGLILITVGLVIMSRSASSGIIEGIQEGLRDVANAD